MYLYIIHAEYMFLIVYKYKFLMFENVSLLIDNCEENAK